MGEEARAAGIGPELEFRGRKHRLSERTPEMTGLIVAWLEQRAWDALERSRPHTPPHTFAERQQVLMAMVASGEFGWGSVAMARALSLPDGMKELCYLQLKACDETITREHVEEIWGEAEAEAITAWNRANTPDPTKPPEGGQDSASPKCLPKSALTQTPAGDVRSGWAPPSN